MPILIPQQQPRNESVRSLTQALIARQPNRVYSHGAGIASALAPMIAGGLEGFSEGRAQQKEKEEKGQLSRMLREAWQSMQGGSEPGAAQVAGPPGVASPPLSPAQARQSALMNVLIEKAPGVALEYMTKEAFSKNAADPFTLSPGQVRYGPGGEEIASVPGKPEVPTALIRNMNAAGIDPASSEGQEIIRDYLTKAQTQVNVGRPVTLSPGQVLVNPQSGEPIAEGPAKPAKFTDAQSKVATFVQRMSDAEQTIQQVEAGGYEPGGAGEAALRALPGGNLLLNSASQQYRQAQEDWIRAVLRKESGAVIGADEMADEIKTFFPQPGDGNAVREQKAKARRRRVDGLRRESGGAYEAMFGGRPQAASPKADSENPQDFAPQFEGKTRGDLLQMNIEDMSNAELKAYNDALEKALQTKGPSMPAMTEGSVGGG